MRFKELVMKLRGRKGVKDPKALAAHIERQKSEKAMKKHAKKRVKKRY